MDRPDHRDRVRLVGVFVGSVALDPSEAEGDASRVPPARLDPVEGDLNHELRPDEHDVPLATSLQLEQTLGVLLIGGPLSIVLATLPIALGQAMRAIADVGDTVAAR